MGLTDDEGSFLESAFRHREVSDSPNDSDEPAVQPEPAIDDTVELGVVAEADVGSVGAFVDTPGPQSVVAAPVPISEPPVPEPEAPPTLSTFERALVEEAFKKSALIWARTPTSPGGRALWHVWLDGQAYVVTGGDEQPDPGLIGSVVVVVRSKDTTSRLLTLTCEVSTIVSVDDEWGQVTAELAKARLNLRDPEGAPERWADTRTYTVFRLRPTGEPLIEGPGRYLVESGRAVPVPTPATTSSAKPWILHRPGGSGPPLS